MTDSTIGKWPNYSEAEIKAVVKVLETGKVNYQNEKDGEGRKFESEFAKFAGSKYAIAVANGTVALDLALYGLKINSGEVIVPARSFIASASCVVNAGATPIFADVDRDSQNITPNTAESHINENTRAIILVHHAGWPCDMDGFKKLVEGTNIKLIEDCAQAHGAKYKKHPVGGLGDVGAWSFCADKIMTTGGEGGMVTCNDEAMWGRMWSFMNHGKNKEKSEKNHGDGKFHRVHDTIGTNWRLTEMQSAMGGVQLQRMPEWHRQRTENAIRIIDTLKERSDLFRVPEFPDEIEHAFYKLYAFTHNAAYRDKLLKHMMELDTGCQMGSSPEIYREKAFGEQPSIEDSVARALGDTSIMFRVHPGANIDIVIKALETLNAADFKS